uniref:Enoyl-CoA hydratase/isomerase family protein n=1 Tax=Thermorudis peleae TaxID=1382356 RepID=A0A831THB3_9BACT
MEQGQQATTVITERVGQVLVLRLNRPEKLNAISPQMMREIASALHEARVDESVRVVALTGNERAFSVGADIDVFAGATARDLSGPQSDAHLWATIWRFEKPLVAAVSGYAFGGGFELALACDLIVASETARFASPEIRLGLIPGAGGTQHLARRLGKYLAMELVLTGRELSAREAQQLGLVNRVVPLDQYLTEALELAGQIASHSPEAARAAKAAIALGPEMPWDAAVAFERELFLRVFESEEARRAVREFLERRQRRSS